LRVIHTVGPIGEDAEKLKSCYVRVLELTLTNSIKTIAVCGISTGIYGYPRKKAAHVALKTVRKWLENSDNADAIDRIIFCMFLEEEMDIYQQIMPLYFPVYEMPSLDDS
jgi:O-acetyl-ADP-ribose deacetylase (regulator of RNase III)